MSENPYTDFVFALSSSQFQQLQGAVSTRRNKEKYGASDFYELGLKYGRKPQCPRCGSTSFVSDGIDPYGRQRYLCGECGKRFGLLTDSIFNSTNKSFDTWILYITLMTFNVPLDMAQELCGLSRPSALLWRRKIFSTIDQYQKRLKLRERIWIDETYVYDSTVLHEDGYKQKRGLSRDLICIIVAIDIHKNAYAMICGHGKPTSQRVYRALKDHIEEGSIIVHDGEKSHSYLIEKCHCYSEVYIANPHSKEYLENMALINNMCSWLKRYIYRFVGMRKKYLQSYLNWFVYLFRVNGAIDKWPKIPRILRHLVLTEAQYKRETA